MPSTVLLSAPSMYPVDDLRTLLVEAGFAIREHALGATPGVNFASLAVAVVEVGDQADAATAQARRWRAELGDEHLPIIWLLPHPDAKLTARGLDAGADAVLARPLGDGVLQAQLRAAVRSRNVAVRVANRAAEARILGDQLNRTFAQIDRELDLTRRVRLALLQRSLPEQFAVCHRPRGRNGGDFYAVNALDANRVVFLVGDVIGPSTAGGLLGKFLAESVFDAARLSANANASGLLAEANLALLQLKLEDSPLVAFLVGVLDAKTGKLEFARAGLPAPVYVPARGAPETWALPGPFLGVSETTYLAQIATLKPGDKLLIGTDGTRPDGTPGPGDDTRLLAVATQHRELLGQRFLDAVATDLLAQVQHDDDFTLLSLGISG
ncbi:MAG: SpoIIE family protein phosphatase [Planctomycetes bacterium]|nr:SpoIIE family protein phosphatase [Planctomycetota bacterium]